MKVEMNYIRCERCDKNYVEIFEYECLQCKVSDALEVESVDMYMSEQLMKEDYHEKFRETNED